MATPNQPANEQRNDTQPMVSQQLEKIDVTIGGDTKSLTPEELEHLQAQLNSNLKRSKPPSSIAKEEQDTSQMSLLGQNPTAYTKHTRRPGS